MSTCLFREFYEVDIEKKTEILEECKKEDIEKIVIFCHNSMNAPVEWLTGYIGNLVVKGEIFLLENENEIIGTCEVRRSKTSPEFVDIGMVVSPDYRKKGFGTYLLHMAKLKALEWAKLQFAHVKKKTLVP
ncbi:MAG: GNAT family N-acetyltransferase [Saprospiraceae bacterium]|nr:GNAT family N-acetyltransferase [Saprospiraceae bacterium]